MRCVYQREAETTGGTRDAVVLPKGQDGSATEFYRVLVGVKISLAREVLELGQPQFQLPTLKDRISGRGPGHIRRGPMVVKDKSNLPMGGPARSPS
jgi:hypothetical protein